MEDEKQKLIIQHSSVLKSHHTEENKAWKVRHAKEMHDTTNNNSTYQKMYNHVHVDEKRFCMTVDGKCYLLAPGEEPPQRRWKHKRFIKKVMFLCAQAHPCKVNGEWWDGKIGIWPIGHMGKAERDSINRPAGAPVQANESVIRDKHHETMIDVNRSLQ